MNFISLDCSRYFSEGLKKITFSKTFSDVTLSGSETVLPSSSVPTTNALPAKG